MKKAYTFLLCVVVGVATLFQCQQKSKKGKTDEQISGASSKQKVITPTGTRFKHTKKDTAKIYTKKYKLSLPNPASLKNIYGAYASFSKLKTHFGFDTTDILKDGITIPKGAEGVGVFNALDNKGKHINYFVFTDIDTLSSGKKNTYRFYRSYL
jgi:hypothetical protein